MADSKPAAEPQPQPEPEPQKSKTARGIVNQKQMDALDKAALVVAVARKPEYAPRLAAAEIGADFLNQLQADIAACNERVGKANEFTTMVRSATEAERQAQADLLAALKEIQARAKQKYARGDAQQTRDYYVGQKADVSRAMLLQVADSIAGKLKTDTLPGVTPEKVAGLKALRDAYFAANAAQLDAQAKSTAERKAIESAVQSISDRRAQIQYAVEAEWPCGDKANAPIRREFQLPADRPFTG